MCYVCITLGPVPISIMPLGYQFHLIRSTLAPHSQAHIFSINTTKNKKMEREGGWGVGGRGGGPECSYHLGFTMM